MNEREQLARIANAHAKRVDTRTGITSGYCEECDRSWPCPTHVWATEPRDPCAPWDPDDDGVA